MEWSYAPVPHSLSLCYPAAEPLNTPMIHSDGCLHPRGAVPIWATSSVEVLPKESWILPTTPSLLGQIVLPCLINSFLWLEHSCNSLWVVIVRCVRHPLFISETGRYRPEKCPMKAIFLLEQRRGCEDNSLAFILVLLNI